MAWCELKMPDEYMERLSKLGDRMDDISEEVVKAGAHVAVKYIRKSLSEVIGKELKGEKLKNGETRRTESRSTGELVDSLGVAHRAFHTTDGRTHIKIGFNEPRIHQYPDSGRLRTKKGKPKARSYQTITNAMIGATIEYGKHGQPAKPFLKKGMKRGQEACEEAMIRKFEEEVSKL